MADQKLTALTAITSVTDDDLLYVVDDPGGSPLSRKITVSDFKASFGLSDFSANGNWKVFYTDGTGAVTELALGAANSVLTSNGASSAPTFTALPPADGNGIYDGSGSLSGNTTVTMATNNLIFDASGGGDVDFNILNGGGDFTISTLTYTNSFRVTAGTTQINAASLSNDALGGGVRFAAGTSTGTRITLANIVFSHENGAGTERSLLSYFSDGITVGAYSNHDYNIRTNNIQRIKVEDGGNVAIGNLSPTEKLHCDDKIRSDVAFNLNGTDGIGAVGGTTYTFGGGGSGDIATMTFNGGILTAVTTVP